MIGLERLYNSIGYNSGPSSFGLFICILQGGNMLVICYKKCGTCRKLEKILNEKNIAYDYRHIDQENPSKEEIKKWHDLSGLDIKRFFNTSGGVYREENLKDKLPNMTLEEKYNILSTNGMLVKRPIILDQDKVYVGPDAVKFAESL